MSEKGVRRGIIDAIFNQGDAFTASFIASEVGERPTEVHAVIDLMECVAHCGIAQGVQGRGAILYQVTKTPPDPCTTCHFNASRISSCGHAPNHSDAADTERSMRHQQWERYLQACDEARTGHLTNVDGDPILSVGHL